MPIKNIYLGTEERMLRESLCRIHKRYIFGWLLLGINVCAAFHCCLFAPLNAL